MIDFVELVQRLDETTSTNAKLAALDHYFHHAPHEDIAHAIYFLSGNKLIPTVPTRILRAAAMKASGIPGWLFQETYEWVGDLAETTAAIAPGDGRQVTSTLSDWIAKTLHPIARSRGDQQIDMLIDAWSCLTSVQRFVMNKLITGSFRVGVSQKLLTRGISQWSNIPTETIAHRMMGGWKPSPSAMSVLLNADARDSDISRPYPFCLAYPIVGDAMELGATSDYLAEWKWDGIRAQLVRRNNTTYLWSRGEESLQGRFPEIEAASELLANGTVLDGEILAMSGDHPKPFVDLQKRIQRKRVGPKLLRDCPVAFVAYDLLEHGGEDIRMRSLAARRSVLDSVMTTASRSCNVAGGKILRVSPSVHAESWAGLKKIRTQARDRGSEGLMLKRLDSPYGVGRITGLWWKWKLDPYSVDAVMLYAQRGHGRRATLFTDYTFGVWNEGTLVPFAKAYSGLTEEEIRVVDRWIRENTIDKFGPVCAVRPELVMEIAFENVQLSTRHKSGIAVRFPRISRIRSDKTVDQADSLEALRKWIADPSQSIDNPDTE